MSRANLVQHDLPTEVHGVGRDLQDVCNRSNDAANRHQDSMVSAIDGANHAVPGIFQRNSVRKIFWDSYKVERDFPHNTAPNPHASVIPDQERSRSDRSAHSYIWRWLGKSISLLANFRNLKTNLSFARRNSARVSPRPSCWPTLPVRRHFILQLAIDFLAFIACLIAGLALILSIPLAMVLMLLASF